MGKLVSFRKAAEESDTSHWTWRRLADQGAIKSVRIGARRLIPKEEVERVLANGAELKRAAREGVGKFSGPRTS